MAEKTRLVTAKATKSLHTTPKGSAGQFDLGACSELVWQILPKDGWLAIGVKPT